ncbi:MAG: FGGY-family carbohydrate kinase [Candidatus Caldarchaeum sp.]|nr:FGGY-family carbohydrate kinase [Candidatus Caldarchaeum sp.]
MIVGVDIGTSSVKSIALSEEGEILWSSARELSPLLVDGSNVEFDAEEWYSATVDLLQEFSRTFKPKSLTLCIGGQAPSIVPVSVDGRPLHRAIIWMDGRAMAEAEKLKNLTGEEVDSYTAESKLLWFKENLPSVYERARYFMHCFDFVTYRLTGIPSVGLLDRGYYTWESIPYWRPDHLELAGFDVGKLPPACSVGDYVGSVKPDVADNLGIPRQTDVVQGTVDFAQSIVGVGAVEPGVAMDHGGTSQGFDLCWHQRLRPVSREFNCVKHVVRGFWNISGVMNTTGAALRWLKNNFYPPNASYALVDEEAARSRPGQIVVLPFFQGERTPFWNPKARGVFFGLQFVHGRGDIARALMEATAYGLRRIMETIRNAGGIVKEIRVAGGQANSELWNQIKADVLGTKILKPRVMECSPLGAAIIAAVNRKLFKDFKDAADNIVEIEKIFTPRPDNAETYDKRYQNYLELYEAVKDLFNRF